MKVLLIDGAFRDGSRTRRLAEYYVEKFHSADCVERVELGDCYPAPLDRESLRVYNRAVENADYQDEIFDCAKQFVAADVILIAAPFWNYSIPAALHAYLELVCSQGVSFDMDEKGNYFSLCHAKKLVFFTTAGGYIPEVNCAFGYIQELCRAFWRIDDVRCYQAEALDIIGTDVEAALAKVCSAMT